MVLFNLLDTETSVKMLDMTGGMRKEGWEGRFHEQSLLFMGFLGGILIAALVLVLQAHTTFLSDSNPIYFDGLVITLAVVSFLCIVGAMANLIGSVEPTTRLIGMAVRNLVLIPVLLGFLIPLLLFPFVPFVIVVFLMVFDILLITLFALSLGSGRDGV